MRMIQGKYVVAVALAVALAMASLAGFYHYRASHQAAQFWGRRDVTLLMNGPRVVLCRFGGPGRVGPEPVDPPAAADEAAEEEAKANPPQTGLAEELASVVGLPVGECVELSAAPGLVHLRHAFTQDAHFDWSGASVESPAQRVWSQALGFVGAEGETAGEILWVLLSANADLLGRVRPATDADRPDADRPEVAAGNSMVVDVLPCPRLAGPVSAYLKAEGN